MGSQLGSAFTLGASVLGVSEASSLGLTGGLHRELSTMSSDGEGQGRTVPRRHLSQAEKVAQVTEAKKTGALVQEEKAETGTVSRADQEGWRA